MRHIVPDSYRGNPSVYDPHKNTYYPTYRKNIAQLAFEAVVTRRLGAYKPFWAKGLDYAVPKGKWVIKKGKTIWQKTPKKKYLAIGHVLSQYGKTSKRKYPKRKICTRRSPGDKHDGHRQFRTCKRSRRRNTRPNKRSRYFRANRR